MALIHNGTKSNFTQIPNGLITDRDLSNGAFRVACYLFSKPDKWEVNNIEIMRTLGIGQKQTLANYFKELVTSGWLQRTRARNSNGTISGGFDYSLSMEKPDLSSQPKYGETLSMENPYLGKTHTHSNTDNSSNTKININTEGALNSAAKKQGAKKKNTHLIKEMATDFDVAFSHLSDPKKNGLNWGAAAAEKISWSGKEIGNLAHLRETLATRLKQKAVEPTEEMILANWRLFLQMVVELKDDFLNRNFTPSVLYSQFNQIILKLNQQKNGNPASNSKRGKPIDPNILAEVLAESIEKGDRCFGRMFD